MKAMKKSTLILVFLTLFLSTIPGVHAGVNASNSLLGVQLLPPDNIWNVPIDTMPVDPHSATWIQGIGSEPMRFWPGEPLNVLDNTLGITPQYLTHIEWCWSSDNVPYPFPAVVQRQPADNSDQIVQLYNRETNTAYWLYHAVKGADGTWSASQANAFNMSSNFIRNRDLPYGKNLPEIQGELRYEEVASGSVNHAIQIMVRHTNESFVWPYFFTNGEGYTNGIYPPLGQRFRLKSSVDISGYPPQSKAIAQALKTYGGIVTDQHGSTNFIQLIGIMDDRWCDSYNPSCDLHILRSLDSGDFEAVDTSSLMISRDSMQARTTPVASFTGTPLTGTAPLTVTFTDSSTNSPTSWAWTFGDGGTSTVRNPSHQYTTAGTYTVSLKASNTAGTNTLTRTNYITVTGPPVASFTGTPFIGTAPLTVTFADSSTNSPTSWNWSFGDGGTSTVRNPVHTYTATGNYTVALNVTNVYGSNKLTKDGLITVARFPPMKVGVFRSAGTWYLDMNNNGAWDVTPADKTFSWGKQPGDIPITGDWNGNNITKTGIFRRGTGFYLDMNNNGKWDATSDKMLTWGLQPNDIPVIGDWNGDTITETGIFRGGTWYLDMNNNGAWDGTPTDKTFSWGKQPGDIPITGDWNGNTITEPGIFHGGTWYLDMNNNGAWDGTPTDKTFSWGKQPGDIPTTGDWNGDTITETGIFRNGDWYLDRNNNGLWDQGIDLIFPIGQPGDKPVTGKW